MYYIFDFDSTFIKKEGLEGLADYFVAFVENIRREKVVKEADMVVDSLGEFLLCEIKKEKIKIKKGESIFDLAGKIKPIKGISALKTRE